MNGCFIPDNREARHGGTGLRPSSWFRRRSELPTTALLAALFFAMTASGQEVSRSGGNGEHERLRTIAVSGRGEIRVRPDEATVRLGVEAQSDDAATAQEAVNSSMRTTITRIKDLGIQEPAIQTTGLTLSPMYAPHKPGREVEQRQITGYRASNTIRVRTTDLGLVGRIIDVSLKSGANRLEGVSFGLSDELQHQTRALKLAAEEARTKAQALAEALDLRLARVHKVHSGHIGIPFQRASFGMAEMAAAGTPTPVQPGELLVEASVTVEYEIEAAAGGSGD